MVHVAETGEGLADANAYYEAAAVTAYWADHGAPAAWTAADEPTKELAGRTVTQFLDATYGRRWRGTRKLATQALDWPRVDVESDDGFCFSSTALPAPLLAPYSELCLKVVNGEVLAPDISTPGTIASESKQVGPISISKTYIGGKSQTKKYTLVLGLLAPLLQPAGLVIKG